MELKNKRIDIVIAQLVEKGGFDKVLNDVMPYLQKSGYHIRLIQLVDYGIEWVVDGVESTCVCGSFNR